VSNGGTVASRFSAGRPIKEGEGDGDAERRVETSEDEDGVGIGVATFMIDGGAELAGDAVGVDAR
jgi:hypothetical protein